LPARITLDGIAGVVPGMTPDEVERRWGVLLLLPDNVHSLGCRRAEIEAGAMRGHALFAEDRLSAAIFNRGAVTDKGIRIGSTLAALRRAYGARLTSRPAQGASGGREYFVARRAAPRWELRFDVSRAGRVAQIGFGAAALRGPNGCLD